MYKKMIGMFFGLHRIMNIEETAEKTFRGNDKLVLTFEDGGIDGRVRMYPKKVVEDIVTEKPIDLTELREKRAEIVVGKILEELVESEMTYEDIDYTKGPKLQKLLDNAIELAAGILWGKPSHRLTMWDVEQVLRKERAKKNGGKK